MARKQTDPDVSFVVTPAVNNEEMKAPAMGGSKVFTSFAQASQHAIDLSWTWQSSPVYLDIRARSLSGARWVLGELGGRALARSHPSRAVDEDRVVDTVA